MRLASILLLGVACLAPGGETTARWRMQYFYDQDNATFQIADLKFTSPKNGMAIGEIYESNKKTKPISAITTDGGAHWSLVPIKAPGFSLFFLNDSMGWMVAAKSLWQTEDFGKTWRKLKAPEGLAQVHFVDANHGWAVGIRKQVYETKDGGVTWTDLPGLDKVNSSKENTEFAWIEFADKDTGLIGGWSKPRRKDQQSVPDWLDPETASTRREWPHLGILIDTHDGGKSWAPSYMSVFGEITRAKLSPEGWGIGLIEFSDAFEWPSEVYFLDWKTGKQKRIFREKDRKVTDVAIAAPKGPVYLGAIEHFGTLQQLPIPRKVKILRSDDAETFTDMPVDYRAVARRVMLASAGPDDVWAATDTGMILKLTR